MHFGANNPSPLYIGFLQPRMSDLMASTSLAIVSGKWDKAQKVFRTIPHGTQQALTKCVLSLFSTGTEHFLLENCLYSRGLFGTKNTGLLYMTSHEWNTRCWWELSTGTVDSNSMLLATYNTSYSCRYKEDALSMHIGWMRLLRFRKTEPWTPSPTSGKRQSWDVTSGHLRPKPTHRTTLQFCPPAENLCVAICFPCSISGSAQSFLHPKPKAALHEPAPPLHVWTWASEAVPRPGSPANATTFSRTQILISLHVYHGWWHMYFSGIHFSNLWVRIIQKRDTHCFYTGGFYWKA